MAKPKTTLLIHLWLFLTRVFAFLFKLSARRAHRRMDAQPQRFAERLGQTDQTTNGPVIWFHAASLGEVMQIGPLVRQLTKSEAKPILVTT
ncbi:MAG: glycosyltransferase N-terminal domain-containing protein, partial [Pseudomonadota bacterium]